MEEFQFKMVGSAFDEGFPLHLALSSLQDVQAIFDKTYLGLTGKQRISKIDRQQFYLRTFEIKNGCLLTDLHIYLEQAQLIIPAIAPIVAPDIWNYTSQVFDFLKLVYGFARQGKEVRYQANDNGTVNVHTGDNVNVYNAPVIQIAPNAAPHWRSLNHKLKEGQIDSYSMGASSSPEIAIGASQREIFDIPTHIDQEPIVVVCDIYDFNKRENIGKLAVAANDNLPDGDYRFQVLGNQDQIDYIASMAQSSVKITVLREMRVDPVGKTNIVKLHVMGLNP